MSDKISYVKYSAIYSNFLSSQYHLVAARVFSYYSSNALEVVVFHVLEDVD
jgi:hypothetical protein